MYKDEKTYTLMRKTLQLLKRDGRSTLEIHKLTGLPFYWLRKFRSEEFKHPSVNRVQCLYEFLSDNKLAV